MGWRDDCGYEQVELGIVAGCALNIAIGANERGGDAVLVEPASDALGIIAGENRDARLR